MIDVGKLRPWKAMPELDSWQDTRFLIGKIGKGALRYGEKR